MSVATRKEFIACVTKSNAIPEEKLTAWLEVVDEEDPKKIAAKLVRDKLLTAWQAKFLISGRSRLSVGNYILRSRISRDELGDKFEAIHSQLNRKVVIQVFPSSIAKNEALLQRLLKKLRQITELDHPNLVHIYDVDQESERYFLVAEYVEGETLNLISPKDMTDTEIADIIHGIASGLSYAHQNEILHGNVTAENIFVTPNGKAELQGFPSAILSNETGGNDITISESDDFSRLAKIGSTLLKEMPKVSRSENFTQISAMVVGLKDDEKRDESLASLKDWVTSNLEQEAESSDIQLQPEDDSFISETSAVGAGDFDSPMATVPQTTLKKKKSKESEGTESEDRPFLKRMWQDKRNAFIASAAALSLAVIGGLGAIGYALTSESASSGDTQIALEQKKKNSGKKNMPLATSNAAEGALSLENRKIKSTSDVLDPEANRRKLAEFYANTEGTKDVPKQSKKSAWKKKNKKNRQKNKEDAEAKENADVKIVKSEPSANSDASGMKEENGVEPNPPTETGMPPKNTAQKIKLSIVEGLGVKTEAYLKDGGVETLEQLAAMSPEEVQAALVKGNWKGTSRIKVAADWIAEAKKLTGDNSPMKQSGGSTAAASASTAKVGKKSPKASKAAPKISAPFKKFAKRIDLPEPTDTSDLKLGRLVIAKNHLLGLTLLAGPEIARNKVDLKLNRSENDKQLWDVELAAKRSGPIAIAQLQKTPTEMNFRWLPGAAKNKNSTALRNCMLKLSTPNESHWLGLRSPVKIKNFNFVDDKGFVKIETEIDSLPNPSALKTELLPIFMKVKKEFESKGDKPIGLSYNPRQITKSEPGRIYFHDSVASRYFYVAVTADIRKKSRFSAQMMLAFPNSSPQQVRSAGELVDISRAIEPQKVEAMDRYQHSLKAKKPAGMDGSEFNRLKKEAKDNADNFNRLAEVSIQNIAIAKELSGKKLKLQVYFEMEGHRIIVAHSK